MGMKEILEQFDCKNCKRNKSNGGECDPDNSRCEGFKEAE